MDLRAVKVFVLAAKSLSFTRAAELLYMSPSSVSKYIAQLESEVGRPLFTRDTRKVELSDYGRALLPYAEELWQKDQEMTKFISMRSDCGEMSTITFGMAEELRVNPPQSRFDKILRAFAQFRREKSSVFMTLRYMPEGDLVKAVSGGALEAALLWDKYFDGNEAYMDKVNYFRLMRERRYLMFSPRKYPDIYSSDDLGGIAGKVIFADNIMSAPSAHTLTRLYFGSAEATGCNTWAEEFLRVIAEEGMGFIEESLVPLAESVGLRCVLLEGADYGCDVCVVWRKNGARPDTLRFVELMKSSFSHPEI